MKKQMLIVYALIFVLAACDSSSRTDHSPGAGGYDTASSLTQPPVNDSNLVQGDTGKLPPMRDTLR